MQDAVEALRAAVAELTQAAQTLPDDLRRELEALVTQAQGVLASIEDKLEPTAEG
jgi:hypothetical protein